MEEKDNNMSESKDSQCELSNQPQQSQSQQVKTVDCSAPKENQGRTSDRQAQPEPSPMGLGAKEQKEESEEDVSNPISTPVVRECVDKDRPVRLFIGQVPETMMEQHITALFHSKGIQLLDVSIIRDKNTGRHRHCCFITVTNREAADQAIAEFHNRRYLEAMANPMQVREANQPKSKAAYAAMRAYSQLLGTAMPVFADSTSPGNSTGTDTVTPTSLRCNSAKSTALFNYRLGVGVPQYVPFNPFLQTHAHAQYHPHGAPYYYQYLAHPQPQPQHNSLNFMPHIPGVGVSKQNKDGELPIAAYGYPLNDMSFSYQNMNMYSSVSPNASEYNPYILSTPFLPRTTTYVEGPPGANLFVNNLPPNFADEELLKLFSVHGKVLSYKVFVDKYTKISKGFGFVSFSSVTEAQQAISLKNGFRLETGHEIFVELKRPKRLKYPEYF